MDNGMSVIVLKLCERYEEKAKESINRFRVLSMIAAIREEHVNWPVDKANRWIGFIQGVLFAEQLIDLNEERDITRPMFHEYYKLMGLEVPKTIDVESIGYLVDDD